MKHPHVRWTCCDKSVVHAQHVLRRMGNVRCWKRLISDGRQERKNRNIFWQVNGYWQKVSNFLVRNGDYQHLISNRAIVYLLRVRCARINQFDGLEIRYCSCIFNNHFMQNKLAVAPNFLSLGIHENILLLFFARNRWCDDVRCWMICTTHTQSTDTPQNIYLFIRVKYTHTHTPFACLDNSNGINRVVAAATATSSSLLRNFNKQNEQQRTNERTTEWMKKKCFSPNNWLRPR